MPTILVDYENVNGSNGLKGADILNSEDTLIIFYSGCCEKIRYDYMQEIKESGCEFRVIKLKGKGKKALYTGALHEFGREDGRAIYQLLKNEVVDSKATNNS